MLQGRGKSGCGTGGGIERGGLTDGEAGAVGSQEAGLKARVDGGDMGGQEVRSREGRGKADRRRDEGGEDREGEVDREDGGSKGIGRGGERRATKVTAVGVRMMRLARAMMKATAEEAREWRLPSFLHSNLSASCSHPLLKAWG